VTETELLTAITSGTRARPGLCKVLGIRYFHPHDARRSVPGWPDLALLGRRGLAFRELKSATGIITPQQREWGYAFRTAGFDWDVWRPCDLASGRITTELRALMTG